MENKNQNGVSRQDFEEKIKHLVPVLVVLPGEQKDRILKGLSKLTISQLQVLTIALEDAFEKQKDLLREGFKKDPLFAQKFDSYQKAQVKKMRAEAANSQNRGSMKDYLTFKSQWQKTGE